MLSKIFKTIPILFAVFAMLSFDLPTAWFAAGSDPDKYEMGIDAGTAQDGGNAATIKSINKKIKGFGTLMQNFNPEKFKGKKIKMSAMVKSVNVTDWSGLWLRVDQPNSNYPLSFDNMEDRPIKGTTNWKKYEILLDVPEHASNIAYGCLLSGTGQVWFDKFTFEILGNIESKKFTSSNAEPTNTDFENTIQINQAPK